ISHEPDRQAIHDLAALFSIPAPETFYAANRGSFDPFNAFDWIFGAVRLNLKVTDLPIRYRERTYGTTNIQRWKRGWLLLKMVIFATTLFVLVWVSVA